MAKDSYYFSHDSNARNDVKLIKLRRIFAMEGVGIYWCICEMLREAENYELPISCIPDIAFELRTAEEKIISIINDFNLFIVNETNLFFSDSLKRRMGALERKRQQQIEAGKRGAQKRWKNSDPIADPNGDPNGGHMPSKGKESKVKESKEILRDYENIYDRIYLIMDDNQKRKRADIFLNTMLSDTKTIELIQMQTNIGKAEIIKAKIKEFTTELLVKDRIEMSLKEYRDYFGNWIKKNK